MGSWFLWSMEWMLASAERDDAAHRVVGRNADGDAVTRDDLDAEAAHSAAQLGQDFVARIHLHAIQAAAVHRHDGALDINEVVLAQICCPFIPTSIAGTRGPGTRRLGTAPAPGPPPRPVGPARGSRRPTVGAAPRMRRGRGPVSATSSSGEAPGRALRAGPGTTGRSRRAAIMPTPGRKLADRAVVVTLPLRKDQHGVAVAGDLADVAQRLARAGLALRQRERVEELAGEVVVQAVGEPGPPRRTRRG